MFDEISEPAQAIVQVAASFDPPSKHERAAAVTAIEALREHGNIRVARNLQAGASLASLKAVLSHGEFGPFCERKLAISPSYRARLLKLNDVREHLSSAQAWAATQKHRLAECQSAQNLIKLVNDWLKKDEPPKPKADLKRPSQGNAIELELATQEGANLVAEREKTISELKSELAKRDDSISDLQRRLTEYEQDFIALRAHLPDEVREKALVALTSSHDRELATIAKRHHWRESDLRRELES
jgi:recombinational DNA repair ATPase RecF